MTDMVFDPVAAAILNPVVRPVSQEAAEIEITPEEEAQWIELMIRMTGCAE